MIFFILFSFVTLFFITFVATMNMNNSYGK